MTGTAGLTSSSGIDARMQLWQWYLTTMQTNFGATQLPLYAASGLFLSAKDDRLAEQMIAVVTADVAQHKVRACEVFVQRGAQCTRCWRACTLLARASAAALA